jgi:glyoxylase-like metal-dependent hydrolase (beta-lactamase superfamily II)
VANIGLGGGACEPHLPAEPAAEPAQAAQIRVTGQRQVHAWAQRVLPPVERVRPGLWSVPVPIPHNPLRYVLVYAIDLPDGVALVDTGWPVEDAWDVLVAGLAEAGYAIGDVRAVLVTHHHPDHAGLAGRVRAASGAWVGMHPAEARSFEHMGVEALLAFTRSWLHARGAPESEVQSADQLPFALDELLASRPDRLIEDGDTPLGQGTSLRAVWTPGHTAGHLCFFDEVAGLLFAGDHVLPRISPNIMLMDPRDTDPLSDFLESLTTVAKLPVDEVLPAHEYRFAGLEHRVAQLRGHHERRLSEVERLVVANPDSSTYAIASLLTWSRPWSQLGTMRRAAIGEALAHLVLLRRHGRVQNLGTDVDRWRTATEGGAGEPFTNGR